jgi:hypothetical protein
VPVRGDVGRRIRAELALRGLPTSLQRVAAARRAS